MKGLQCPKLLWFEINQPDKIPSPDPASRHVMDQGIMVGNLAKKQNPGGIDLSNGNFSANISETNRFMRVSRTLFEAGIMVEGLYSRVDILKAVEPGVWDIIEVKSTTQVKEEHLAEVAFQRFCCEKRGLKIRDCFLTYVNNKYVRKGDVDPEQLFATQNITAEVNTAILDVERNIAALFGVMRSENCPDTLVGPHCSRPNDCPVNCCWEALPENTILELYRGGQKKFELLREGVLRIKDVPPGYKLTKVQQTQKWCEENSCAFIDPGAVKAFISTLEYPIHYLDFETINPAIPLFDGTRPYQQIPFQFSVHVDDGSTLRHYSFLAGGSDDPRVMLLSELKRALGEGGSVLVYNQTFEKRVLEDLSLAFPGEAGSLKSVSERIIDLYAPFKNFDYYHPEQHGSASIKAVLPVLTGKGYEGLAIGKGDDASLAFLRLMESGISDEERRRIRSDLETYCCLDTEGMIWLLARLRDLCA